MNSLVRAARLSRRSFLPSTSRAALPSTQLSLSTVLVQQTRFASKKAAKTIQSTSSFVPGSQVISTDPAALEEYAKCESKMNAAIEWYRREVAASETRAAGRVTPAVLAPVRVTLPGGGDSVRLEEVATVGVREGTMLLVTVYEEANLKHVETGIYSAKLTGVTPQKHDARTLKIPIPKPTVESRLALYGTAQKQAEEVRVQLRKHHSASVKKGGFKKFSVELDGFQKLMEKSIAEVDKILAAMKKAAGAK